MTDVPHRVAGAKTRYLRIHVLFFAAAAELAGTRRIELDLSPVSTIDAIWPALSEQAPAIARALAPLAGRIALSRNGRYARRGEELADGDEVAMIPPVSGG